MKKYSWEDSVENHLADFSYMSSKEKEAFLNSRRFNVPIRTILELLNQHNLDSIEFTDDLTKILFENMGDYEDLQPYGPDSIAKLADDERAFLEDQVQKIKNEVAHSYVRRMSFVD